VLRDARLGSFSMSALTGRVVGGVSPDATRLEYSLSSPGVRLELRAEGTESKLDLGEIRAEGAGQLAGDDGHFLLPSHTAGSVASTTWSSAMPGVGPISASFRNARYESDSTLADGLWSTSTKTTAEGSIQGIALDKLESAGAIKRLHAATLEGLVHKAIGTLLSCDAATAALGPLALLGELDSAARELLPHNPEYAIGPVAVELGGKRAELSYSLGVRGVEAADAAQPPLAIAMQKGVVRAEAKLSIGLLDELVKLAAGPLSSYGALPGVSPQAAQAAASDPAQMVAFAHLLVDQAVGEGYLRRNGDELSAVAELAAGELSVNGKPVSLPSIDTPTAP